MSNKVSALIVFILLTQISYSQDYVTKAEADKIRAEYETAIKRKRVLDELEEKQALITETAKRTEEFKKKIAETERIKKEAIDNYNNRDSELTEYYNNQIKLSQSKLKDAHAQLEIDRGNCPDLDCKNTATANYNSLVSAESESNKTLEAKYQQDKNELTKEFKAKTKELNIDVLKNPNGQWHSGGF